MIVCRNKKTNKEKKNKKKRRKLSKNNKKIVLKICKMMYTNLKILNFKENMRFQKALEKYKIYIFVYVIFIYIAKAYCKSSAKSLIKNF